MLLKAVWYGAEQFGNIVGMAKGGPAPTPTPTTSTSTPTDTAASTSASTSTPTPAAAPGQRRLSRAEAFAAIRADYDVTYFISGKGGMGAYAPDCVFADPFASFRGVERFKRNVGNLGALLYVT